MRRSLGHAVRAAVAVAAAAAALAPASLFSQDDRRPGRRVPLDARTVSRKNAEALAILAKSRRVYSIAIGTVPPARPERIRLAAPDDSRSRALLDRARTLLVSPEARLRNLVVEVRKEYFRGDEESSERHRVWAEVLLETEGGRRLGLNEIAESLVFDPRNARAWEVLERELPAEGKRLVERPALLRADVVADGGEFRIVLDPAAASRPATAAWLAYARTRALWVGEGRFAERFGSEAPYRVTGAEMIEAFESLVDTYEIERTVDPAGADPELDRLAALRGEGLLRAFVHVDVAPGPLAESRTGGAAPDAESVREYLGRHRVHPPSR